MWNNLCSRVQSAWVTYLHFYNIEPKETPFQPFIFLPFGIMADYTLGLSLTWTLFFFFLHIYIYIYIYLRFYNIEPTDSPFQPFIFLLFWDNGRLAFHDAHLSFSFPLAPCFSLLSYR